MGGDQLQRFLRATQIRLDPFADPHLLNEHPTEQPHTQQYQGNDEAGAKRGVVPAGENGIQGRCRRNHQRIRFQLSIAVEALDTINHGSERRMAGGRQRQELLEDIALRQ
ncbi:hypothetical protein D3C72_1452500 [compost metagenome]